MRREQADKLIWAMSLMPEEPQCFVVLEVSPGRWAIALQLDDSFGDQDSAVESANILSDYIGIPVRLATPMRSHEHLKRARRTRDCGKNISND